MLPRDACWRRSRGLNAKALRRKERPFYLYIKFGGAVTENYISHQIIGAAIEVHRELGGPGLLEVVYEEALALELESASLEVHRQRPVPLVYKGVEIKKPLYIDLLVAGKVVIEVKAVERFNPLYASQLLTYLRLGNFKLGLVINFGDKYLKNGIHRVVNGCPEH